MSRSINVHFLPTLTTPESLAGKVTVVVDVLRATTTIARAFASGAKALIPCLDIEQAREQAQKYGSQAILGGERGGLKIAGFDLGNSPTEYTPENVQGKTILFTTTNGTRAMQQAHKARRVLLAAFSNLSAICHCLMEYPEIEILCAGTGNKISREDILLAGAIIDRLGSLAGEPPSLNDEGQIAVDSWKQAMTQSEQKPLSVQLRESHGGVNLLDIHQGHDIEIAAQIDLFEIVLELDLSTWRIGPAKEP